jgi:hypothetical protein
MENCINHNNARTRTKMAVMIGRYSVEEICAEAELIVNNALLKSKVLCSLPAKKITSFNHDGEYYIILLKYVYQSS